MSLALQMWGPKLESLEPAQKRWEMLPKNKTQGCPPSSCMHTWAHTCAYMHTCVQAHNYFSPSGIYTHFHTFKNPGIMGIYILTERNSHQDIRWAHGPTAWIPKILLSMVVVDFTGDVGWMKYVVRCKTWLSHAPSFRSLVFSMCYKKKGEHSFLSNVQEAWSRWLESLLYRI